jgi:hypothetical protein
MSGIAITLRAPSPTLPCKRGRERARTRREAVP